MSVTMRAKAAGRLAALRVAAAGFAGWRDPGGGVDFPPAEERQRLLRGPSAKVPAANPR